jgi:uncharacterized protein (DUF169 family)
MTALRDFRNYGDELRERLMLKSYPIAVKMLKKEKEIPKGAIRPKKDMGQHLALCQTFAMARREGSIVAMLKKDHWCYVPVIALGQARTPDYILKGNMEYPGRIASLQAAKNIAKNAIHLECGKYAGIVAAPLKSTPFKPDLVIIYCNPAQLRFLLGSMRYKDGYRITTTLEPGGACVNATVPVLLKNECNVTVPCMGDCRLALAQDDEMIFSVPGAKLDDLMAGIRHFDAEGAIYPIKYVIRPESPTSESYRKAGKTIGLDM